MKNNNIQAKISVLLKKLDVLSQNLNDQQLSNIELDLMKDYLRQLYDLVDQLKEGDDSESSADTSPNFEDTPHVTSTELKEDSAPEIPETVKPSIEEKGEPEGVSGKVKSTADKESEARQENNLFSQHEDHEEDEEDYNSINDQFSGPEMLADQLNKSRIKDLRKEIDINDRFWFIRELFNGDSKVYEETVRTLQDMADFKQASTYIDNDVKPNFEWEGKDRIVGKFLNFVSRRFSD